MGNFFLFTYVPCFPPKSYKYAKLSLFLNCIIACLRLMLGLSICKSHIYAALPIKINYLCFKFMLPIIEPSLIIYRL